MANETVVELEFDPIFGTRAKKKLVKESEETGDKSGKRFSKEFNSNIGARLGKGLRAALLAPLKSTAVLVAGAFAGLATGILFRKSIEEASQLERSLMSVKQVAGAYGITANEINKATQDLASDGLIPLADVTDSLRNLIQNFDGDLEKSVNTFKSLRDAAAVARQGQLSLGEAVRGASEGLKNDISNKVDNAGVTKNLSILQKEYAASIGTSVGKLTEAQKAQAEYLGVQKEASVFQGAYNKLLLTFDGALTALKTSFRFLLANFGAVVTSSPSVIALLVGITNEVRRLTGFLAGSNQDIFKNFILNLLSIGKGINTFIIRPLTQVMDVLRLLGSGFNFFKNMVLNTVAKIATGIISILPDGLISDRLRAAAEGFEQETFDAIGSSLGDIFRNLEAIGNTELSDNIDAALTRMSDNVMNASPNVEGLTAKIRKLIEEMNKVSKTAVDTGKIIGDTIGRALTKTASQGIQALTKSLILGEKGFSNFGKKIAGIIGSMAIQLGETLIFTGLGIESLKSLSGAAAIAAGAGLIALGTILKSFSGGEGGAATGGASGTDIVGSAISDETSEIDELSEPAEPETKVNITVQGDVFDSDETGLRIANILEQASLNENVKVLGVA